MASRHRQVQLLAAAAIAVVFLPALASATDYVVGDKAGWTLNYTVGWPEGKTFKVNDNLVFTYHPGAHTVTEVDGQTFRECDRHGNTIKQWSSGNDTIKLDRPGTRWFFCSVADHCEVGLKLVVHVEDDEPPSAPSPAPSHPPTGSPGGSHPKAPTPSSPANPASSSSSPSSAAPTSHVMTAGEVARAMVLAGAAVAACFI